MLNFGFGFLVTALMKKLTLDTRQCNARFFKVTNHLMQNLCCYVPNENLDFLSYTYCCYMAAQLDSCTACYALMIQFMCYVPSWFVWHKKFGPAQNVLKH